MALMTKVERLTRRSVHGNLCSSDV
jgi:hypothetical protein